MLKWLMAGLTGLTVLFGAVEGGKFVGTSTADAHYYGYRGYYHYGYRPYYHYGYYHRPYYWGGGYYRHGWGRGYARGYYRGRHGW